MSTSANRRRIEIDAQVYIMLEREARWLHIPVTSCATMLLRDALHGRGVDTVERVDERHEALMDGRIGEVAMDGRIGEVAMVDRMRSTPPQGP